MTAPTDISAHIRWQPYADSETLAQALAADVAAQLRRAIAMRGGAALALSGGNTPRRFLQRLSEQALAWEKVAVTLVDERWVPETHERSNARLLRQHLLQGAAAAARFIPLYRDLAEPEQALKQLQAELPAVIDVAVLGMGNDGHTASFFPGGDTLAQALDPHTTARLLPMRADGAGEPRITLTLAALLAVPQLYLHIEGAQKQAVLQRALSGDGEGAGLPVRAVLAQATAPVATYYCP